jgi:hypothetical protein
MLKIGAVAENIATNMQDELLLLDDILKVSHWNESIENYISAIIF